MLLQSLLESEGGGGEAHFDSGPEGKSPSGMMLANGNHPWGGGVWLRRNESVPRMVDAVVTAWHALVAMMMPIRVSQKSH